MKIRVKNDASGEKSATTASCAIGALSVVKIAIGVKSKFATAPATDTKNKVIFAPAPPISSPAKLMKYWFTPKTVATAPMVKNAAMKNPIPQSTDFKVAGVATLIPGNKARIANKIKP